MAGVLTALAIGALADDAAAQATSPAMTVLATEARPTPVSAHEGVIVWSSFDQARRRYRLRAQIDGRPVHLPVGSRTVPFDADVGPDRTGHPVVVYSRCRREPQPISSFSGLPAWRFARGCDLYTLSLGSMREQRLALLSTSTGSETLPSVWRDRVAFARVAEPRDSRRSSAPRLYLGDRHTGRRRELPRGSVGQIERFNAGEEAIGGPGPTSLDLRGSVVTFAWNYIGRSCAPEDPFDEDPLDPPQSTQVWRVSQSSRRLLDQACDANGVLSATFVGAQAAWLRQTGGTQTSEIRFEQDRARALKAPFGSRSIAFSRDVVAVHENGNPAYPYDIATFPLTVE
ncbi:MAG: hypothetical protein M3417_04915 [Actinomycetota bacterium]|nr:hypothetical protein [Actinomycetota bacterium]